MLVPRLICTTALLGLSACFTPVGAGGYIIPKDAAESCREQCERVGLEMTAMAIMAANVGCICGVKDQSAQASASSGGMATILMQRAAEEQSRRNNR